MSKLRLRLEQLVDHWELPADARPRFELLLRMLAEDPDAPTAVADPLEAVDLHVADSLSALGVEGFRTLAHIVDIGSGAGFPGVALAIAMPTGRVDLVEATGRKCAFQERLVGALGLENASVVCTRAEQWAEREGRERYEGAVVRAVGSLATLAEYAAPLLRVGGLLVAWKGRRNPDEERRGAEAAALLGLRPTGVEKVQPFAGSRDRHLHRYEKIAPCPPGYPRRPGMARKRPLGGRRV